MEKELTHHGIKGQKWGVRRFRNADGSLTPAGKKRRRDSWSDDAKSAHEIKSKKSVKQMSNAELRKLNERASLENQYSQLHAANIMRGMAYATVALTAVNTITNIPGALERAASTGAAVATKILGKMGYSI